jgi:hypothetical protein
VGVWEEGEDNGHGCCLIHHFAGTWRIAQPRGEL